MNEVPAVLRDFYKEDTRSEQLFNKDGAPVLIDESYTYLDENNLEQKGTRKVPIYKDNLYIVEQTITEIKSLDDVWRVAKLHKGKHDDIIRLFLGMVNNSTKWDFFEKYNRWLTREAEVLEYNKHLATVNDDGQVVMLPAKEHNKAPNVPAYIDVAVWFLENYYKLRKYAYASRDEQMAMIYNDMTQGTNTFMEHNEKVKTQYPKP